MNNHITRHLQSDALLVPRFASLSALTRPSVEDALKTSAIEGEKLDPDAVRSFVGCRLGIADAGLKEIRDQKGEGLVEILLDATVDYSKEITLERI